jgi:hypothetical protein
MRKQEHEGGVGSGRVPGSDAAEEKNVQFCFMLLVRYIPVVRRGFIKMRAIYKQ